MGWVLPPTSIINQQNTTQTTLQANMMEAFSADDFFPGDSDPNVFSTGIYFISSNTALEDILNMSIRMFVIITHFPIIT